MTTKTKKCRIRISFGSCFSYHDLPNDTNIHYSIWTQQHQMWFFKRWKSIAIANISQGTSQRNSLWFTRNLNEILVILEMIFGRPAYIIKSMIKKTKKIPNLTDDKPASIKSNQVCNTDRNLPMKIESMGENWKLHILTILNLLKTLKQNCPLYHIQLL